MFDDDNDTYDFRKAGPIDRLIVTLAILWYRLTARVRHSEASADLEKEESPHASILHEPGKVIRGT